MIGQDMIGQEVIGLVPSIVLSGKVREDYRNIVAVIVMVHHRMCIIKWPCGTTDVKLVDNIGKYLVDKPGRAPREEMQNGR
jgi:hypothetical protein